MTGRDDRNYHESRAQAEFQCAEQAKDPASAALHRELAALHRRRIIEIVHLGEPQPSPSPLIGAVRPRADVN